MKSHGTIRFEGTMLSIKCAPHVAIKFARNFAGAHRPRAGEFMFSATSEHAYDLEWFRQRYPMTVDPAHRARFAELVTKYEDRLAALATIEHPDYVPPEFALAIPPREYQRVAAALAIESGRLLVCDQLGLGKTITGLCTLVAADALPALVVTMTHLARQWEAELGRFLPKLRVHRITKGAPYEFRDVRVEKNEKGKRQVISGPVMPDVLIINYQKIHGWMEELAGKIRTVIFDEMQELRKHESLKRQGAIAIAERAKIRVGLTATPVYNYGEEIHSIVSVLDADALGGHLEFVHEWCEGPKNMVKDPRALGVYLRENGLMIRRTRKDVGRELAPLTVVRHVVEANTDYLATASANVAELARRVLERVGTSLDQMQAAGEMDYRLRQATGIAKAGPVIEFVRLLLESEDRVLLFGWHRAVYDLWTAELTKQGVPFAMFTGAESDVQKNESVRRFKLGARDPAHARVLIMSLRSGAGLDGLQHVCHTPVVGELDWSPKVIEQGIGRVHRDGQLDAVTAYLLVAEDGSDPVIEDVLGIKEMQAQGIAEPHDDSPIPTIDNEAIVNRIRKLAEDVLRRKRDAIGLRSI